MGSESTVYMTNLKLTLKIGSMMLLKMGYGVFETNPNFVLRFHWLGVGGQIREGAELIR